MKPIYPVNLNSYYKFIGSIIIDNKNYDIYISHNLNTEHILYYYGYNKYDYTIFHYNIQAPFSKISKICYEYYLKIKNDLIFD